MTELRAEPLTKGGKLYTVLSLHPTPHFNQGGDGLPGANLYDTGVEVELPEHLFIKDGCEVTRSLTVAFITGNPTRQYVEEMQVILYRGVYYVEADELMEHCK